MEGRKVKKSGKSTGGDGSNNNNPFQSDRINKSPIQMESQKADFGFNYSDFNFTHAYSMHQSRKQKKKLNSATKNRPTKPCGGGCCCICIYFSFQNVVRHL